MTKTAYITILIATLALGCHRVTKPESEGDSDGDTADDSQPNTNDNSPSDGPGSGHPNNSDSDTSDGSGPGTSDDTGPGTSDDTGPGYWDTDTTDYEDTDNDGNPDTESDTSDIPEEDRTDMVDLLVVVDNSRSMDEEQQILASGFFSLLNALVNPLPDWEYPPVDNVRVAVVSTDMGLQYGENGSIDGLDSIDAQYYPNDARGDNGRFQAIQEKIVDLEHYSIRCDNSDMQCPQDSQCDYIASNGVGRCVGENLHDTKCSSVATGQKWFETRASSKDPDLALQVACTVMLGIDGTGIEQTLEAGLRGLQRKDQRSFIRKGALLAVLVVTDEEDCSIKSNGLFNTPEWKSGTTFDMHDPSRGLLNTACNLPVENEKDYLFDTKRYHDQLIDIKGGDASSVFFAAIVGVPPGRNIGCEGLGNKISSCLQRSEMKLEVEVFESETGPYRAFSAACTRHENQSIITQARPGRRYVEVAQAFGDMGYVYSICNKDWTSAMTRIGEIIADRVPNI